MGLIEKIKGSNTVLVLKAAIFLVAVIAVAVGDFVIGDIFSSGPLKYVLIAACFAMFISAVLFLESSERWAYRLMIACAAAGPVALALDNAYHLPWGQASPFASGINFALCVVVVFSAPIAFAWWLRSRDFQCARR